MIEAVLVRHVGDIIGRSAREAFFMLWGTLWALILGFMLSGVAQAFVSEIKLQRNLGDHRGRAVVRASLLGMASSSCSYAATALAATLVRKGADFVTALIFMIAATNLVIELGLVLLALMGWQFLVAEFVGGMVMITVMATVGGALFPHVRVDAARRHLLLDSSDTDVAHCCVPEDLTSSSQQGSAADVRREKLFAAIRHAASDVRMLRSAIIAGFLVAGALSIAVPQQWWNTVFLHGHGVWTDLENALVGPIIACVSWVCSVGNVPLGNSIWHGGASFGGVMAFVFADLIAAPMLLIYWRQYGRLLTTRIFVAFYLAIVVASLTVNGLFWAIRITPHTRSGHISSDHLRWDATTFLNAFFIVVAVAAYLANRHRGTRPAQTVEVLGRTNGKKVRTGREVFVE